MWQGVAQPTPQLCTLALLVSKRASDNLVLMTRARQLNCWRQRFLLYFGVRPAEMMVGVISLLRHPSRGRVHRIGFLAETHASYIRICTLAAISPPNVI
jgi:hypothetical protein